MPETLPLTTPALIKRYLRMTPGQIASGGAVVAAGVTSVDDAIMQMLADAVSDGFAQACGRNFGAAQYTERRNGTGTGMLVLMNTPVSAIDSLALVGPNITATIASPTDPLTADVDYVFDTRGVIRMICGVFPKGVANVQIVYQAGFADCPSDLAHAATKWAAVRYKELDRLGQVSKSIGGETVTFDMADCPSDVRAIVSRYQLQSMIPGNSIAASL